MINGMCTYSYESSAQASQEHRVNLPIVDTRLYFWTTSTSKGMYKPKQIRNSMLLSTITLLHVNHVQLTGFCTYIQHDRPYVIQEFETAFHMNAKVRKLIIIIINFSDSYKPKGPLVIEI